MLLLEAYNETYMHPELIARTEGELKRKAKEKRLSYMPLPHSSTRWRMIAGNVMLEMMSETGPL